jgi:hypothetical protein
MLTYAWGTDTAILEFSNERADLSEMWNAADG